MRIEKADQIAKDIWGVKGFASIARQYNYKTGEFSGPIVGYYVGYERKGKTGRRLTTSFRGDSFEEALSNAAEHYKGTIK